QRRAAPSVTRATPAQTRLLPRRAFAAAQHEARGGTCPASRRAAHAHRPTRATGVRAHTRCCDQSGADGLPRRWSVPPADQLRRWSSVLLWVKADGNGAGAVARPFAPAVLVRVGGSPPPASRPGPCPATRRTPSQPRRARRFALCVR